MNYHFPHQRILGLKELEEKQAQQEYVSRKKRQLDLEEERERVQNQKEKMRLEFEQQPKKTISEIITFQQWIEYMDKEIDFIDFLIEKAVQEVEKQQEVMLEKMKDTKVWNQWKERSMTAFYKEEERKEQLEADEVAILSHFRKSLSF
ncbi:hypothetical protein CVD28_02170 [Bacillus sp. M6-12]|uniref:flagellar export protein FliJ n=1 Tax=Bacillus sp. M6-12 TaxID=2054166 RepID=UPI000C771E6B|nr:flagellar FliJ family protein [Bacillus sp. M6-12]PLS19238.1 hypothetical protein CVD28_02170 [Bacillus sp. M6-12]